MKPKLYPLALIFTTTVLFLSCKTASKLYQKGNYDEAVELAAKKLQKDPNDPKLLDIIQGSYRYAVEDHESRIHNHSESSNELKWEWIYNEYAALQRMYDAIYKVPDVFTLIKPVNYASYLVTYGERAGDIRFDRGLSLMDRNDKISYRHAYGEFQAALRFKPGHRDIMEKLNESYEYAVTNVVILPLNERGSGYNYSSYYPQNSFNTEEEIIRNLQYSGNNDFVKFYSSWDARSRNIRVDQSVDLRLTTMNLGRYRDDKDTRRVSKEVVIREIVYRPDSIVKEYGKVFADITTTHRTMHSDASLQISVRDENGHWLFSDNVNGNHSWKTEFGSYTGDARALSESDKQLVDRRAEQAPREDEILRCMMEEIKSNAIYHLRNYFSRL